MARVFNCFGNVHIYWILLNLRLVKCGMTKTNLTFRMRRTSTRLPCYLDGTEALGFALNREGVSELVPCVSLGRRWIPAFPANRMQISTRATDEYSPALIHLEVPAKKFLLKKPRGFNLIVCCQCENTLHFSNPHLQDVLGAVTEANGFFLCF